MFLFNTTAWGLGDGTGETGGGKNRSGSGGGGGAVVMIVILNCLMPAMLYAFLYIDIPDTCLMSDIP